MGVAYYRFCRLKSGIAITGEYEAIYQGIIPIVINTARKWFEGRQNERWPPIFGGIHALNLQRFSETVVIPHQLSHKLYVGWYGSTDDPKHEIANLLMETLLGSDLKSVIYEKIGEIYSPDTPSDDDRSPASGLSEHYSSEGVMWGDSD